jgi:hypothetical protein
VVIDQDVIQIENAGCLVKEKRTQTEAARILLRPALCHSVKDKMMNKLETVNARLPTRVDHPFFHGHPPLE